MADTTTQQHILGDTVGLPYAEASVVDGQPASTCPACGEVFVNKLGGLDNREAYGLHFLEAWEREAAS